MTTNVVVRHLVATSLSATWHLKSVSNVKWGRGGGMGRWVSSHRIKNGERRHVAVRRLVVVVLSWNGHR